MVADCKGCERQDGMNRSELDFRFWPLLRPTAAPREGPLVVRNPDIPRILSKGRL